MRLKRLRHRACRFSARSTACILIWRSGRPGRLERATSGNILKLASGFCVEATGRGFKRQETVPCIGLFLPSGFS